MPVPKRRTSKTRKLKRRSHHALKQPGFATCPSCGEPAMPHRVCPKCGHYKDRLAINVDND